MLVKNVSNFDFTVSESSVPRLKKDVEAKIKDVEKKSCMISIVTRLPMYQEV